MSRVKSGDAGQIRPESLTGFREKDKLSISELARRAGIDPSYLNKIEAGEKNPLPSVALRLANALHVKLRAIYDLNPDSGFRVIEIGDAEVIALDVPGEVVNG